MTALMMFLALAWAGPAEKMGRLAEEGEHQRALEVGAAALEKDPDDARVRALMARSDWVLATEQDTVVAYQAWLGSWPDSVLVPQVEGQPLVACSH